MIKYLALAVSCFLVACSASDEKSPVSVKTLLPKELKEISGIAVSDSVIWAITDKPNAQVYKLDTAGRVMQQVEIVNTEAIDIEAVTTDAGFVYIGDVGDNTGDRIERKIIKVAKSGIGRDKVAKTTAEIIEFTFPERLETNKKKHNNFDCESLLSYKDSLYIFTKDREDKETRLYALPKTSGSYSARYISSFNSKGLITDAAINPTNNEVALIGYHKGHRFPFIYLFDNFTGNDFFSGNVKRINLANQPWDWQLEGITYGNNGMLYFACEGTKQVLATFYGIKRNELQKIDKKKKSGEADEDGIPDLTKKGHLKM